MDPTHTQISTSVAEYFEIPWADLMGRSQRQSLAVPRMLAMYLCRVVAKSTLMDIGKSFDRDHTTVMHAIAWAKWEIAHDGEAKRQIKNLLWNLEKPKPEMFEPIGHA
jgi:chromosomal replication initiator protein